MAGRRRKMAPPPQPSYEIGVDGWPIGWDEDEAAIPDWVKRAREVAREGSAQEYLGMCERAVKKHKYMPALMDALKFCMDQSRPLPPWLGAVIWHTLAALYSKKARIWRRNEAERVRREKHLNRWDVVRDLLDRRDELNANWNMDVKWDTVYATAAKYLGERERRVKYSYQLVNKALKTGEREKFYVATFKRQPQTGTKKTTK